MGSVVGLHLAAHLGLEIDGLLLCSRVEQLYTDLCSKLERCVGTSKHVMRYVKLQIYLVYFHISVRCPHIIRITHVSETLFN